MAKKSARRVQDPGGKLPDFAASLGRLLGTTERRANQWLSQSKVLSNQLSAIRDQADKLLRRIAGGATDMSAAVGVGRGSRKSEAAAGKKRGRRKMSAAEKKVVSARMKKYWERRRKAAGKGKKATDGGDKVGNG